MQSSPLMYWAYFLAASIIEDVLLMPLDKNNLTNENIVTLLRGYRISPSEPLQQQLIEIHMGLIRETITSLPISLINQKILVSVVPAIAQTETNAEYLIAELGNADQAIANCSKLANKA